MLKAEKRSDSYANIDDNYERAYLIHHMHHFLEKGEIEHELHHCFLFSEKNKNGRKFKIGHELSGKEIIHCINDEFKGILYDHANNNFEVNVRTIDSKKIYEIQF